MKHFHTFLLESNVADPVPVTIVIAPDKFKGSLTAKQVCAAIEEGLRVLNSSLEIISIPLADGGEGTADLLTELSAGTMMKVKVLDPLFREIDSEYGISRDGRTAFIEMAKASGLSLVKPEDRNPLRTSSFGTGQLILDALKHGVRFVVLGVGGSATNDAGMGMAEALGFSFVSAAGERLKPVGDNLIHLDSIQTQRIHRLVRGTEYTLLCDVDNPLFGKSGAAHIFGPQKGASIQAVEGLDLGLRHFAKIAESTFNMSVNFPGAGAGGGLGAGAKVFLNATVSKGFDFISRATDLENKISKADLVITGEGRIDEQTLSGKVVYGVAKLAYIHQKKCVAFTGKCDLPESKLLELGIRKIVSLVDKNTTEREATERAFWHLKKSVEQTGLYELMGS